MSFIRASRLYDVDSREYVTDGWLSLATQSIATDPESGGDRP